MNVCKYLAGRMFVIALFIGKGRKCPECKIPGDGNKSPHTVQRNVTQPWGDVGEDLMK